jgi:hypothetical protein
MSSKVDKLRREAQALYDGMNLYGASVFRDFADLLDATTPQPWPPQEGVERCLAWRCKEEEWVVAKQGKSARDGSLFWWSMQVGGLHRNPPKFWKPMPPEPEVSK